MKHILIPLLFLFLLIGCKSTPINQKTNKERQGLWIEEYALDSLRYKSIGKYHKGDPIRRWRYYLDNKIIMREKYKNEYCIRTKYHKNGKIESRGNTKLDNNEKYPHWYYTGDWKFFDEEGKLTLTRKYENGKLLSETPSTTNTH